MKRLEEKDLWRSVFSPVREVTWIIVLVTGLLVLQFPLPQGTYGPLLALIVGTSVYGLIIFRWVLPRWGDQMWIHYGLLGINLLVVTCAYYLLYPYEIYLLFIVVVAVAGVLIGRPAALVAALLSAVADLGVTYVRAGPVPLHSIDKLFHLLIFVITGYLTATLGTVIRRQTMQSAKRNRGLIFLLSMVTTATSSLDLEHMLPILAERIANGLPVTFCRICLLDREKHALVTWGAHPARSLSGWDPQLGRSLPLQNLPLHQAAITSSRAVVLHGHMPWQPVTSAEESFLMRDGIQSACIVPILGEGPVLGTISVGETRRWEREPLDADKLQLLQALAAQIGMTIQNAQLHRATARQASRLAVLNEIAQSISCTIEMEDLLERVQQQLQRVLPCDTYYIGLYDEAEQSLDLRILIDEGERFPRQKIAVGPGLASLVIRQRQPLLIRHLSEEMDSLPTAPLIMGQAKPSESWLGIPMLAQERLVGILVLASYRPRAFAEEDVALIQNVAEAVALALDNADHHTQVEEQARRDSLTGVYNHGHFLVALEAAVYQGKEEGAPVSLLMLDIDHFKQYNDAYGHVVGDQVLQQTVAAIQSHLATDFVGRWGGEEFAICLYGANAARALDTAQRIRTSLAACKLDTRIGPILPPTVSIGLATFPDHACDHNELVVMADRELYRAKSAGRDQVSFIQP